jgi:acetate kinase
MTHTLVLNAGSSSLKYKLFRGDVEILAGQVDSVGKQGTNTVRTGSLQRTEPIATHDHLDAVRAALTTIARTVALESITHVLHRVVHGGEKYTHHAVITEEVIAGIQELCTLAPLHNPANLACIHAAKHVLSHATHVAFFDTAFHHTIPKHAFLYGIPYRFYEHWGIRKYGFHGLSHEYIASVVYEKTHRMDRVISCHLGSGSSITAIHHGKSLDTTMGFTPLDGLLMATRSGELDPDIPLFLLEHEHLTTKELADILNKEAGMKGLIGTGDLREIKKMADSGNSQAQLVIDMLCYRIAGAIGNYHITVGGVRTLVFTGGIGEHAVYVRKAVCDLLAPLGVLLDERANEESKDVISAPSSRVTVLVVPANEELHMVKLFLAGSYTQA